MEPIRFADGDGGMLCLIPPGGCSLESLIDRYVFISRTAVPSYQYVKECLSRAARAGVLMLPRKGHLELAQAWDDLFRRIVEKRSPIEEGMNDLDDFLRSREWAHVAADFELDEREFSRAAAQVNRRLDELFDPKRGWWRRG